MSDLISRQKVLNTLDFANIALTDEERTVENYKELLAKCIKVLPSAEIKGEWTEWKGRNGRYNGIPVCSNCNTGFPIVAKDYKFCPNCGARMKGSE